jgi:hypothetical protein
MEVNGMENTAAWAGVILTALGIVVAIGIYLRQRNIKRFEYQTLTSRELMVDTKIGGDKKLRVRYGEREANDPRLTLLKLLNSGRVEIRSDDFEQPIRVVASPKASIVFTEVVGTNPDDLHPIITIVNERTLELKPLLLNAKDWVELQLLVDGDPTPLELSGRIAGVQRINDANVRLRRNQLIQSQFGMAIGILSAILGLLIVLGLLDFFRQVFR